MSDVDGPAGRVVRRGDVAWAPMSPTVGHEQSGHRPHLVLSDERLHRTRRIAIVVPMTTVARPWPTRIELADGSFAVAEQPITMSLDRITRTDPAGHNTSAVIAVINRLIGGR